MLDVDLRGGGLSSHPARGWVFLLALDHPSSRSVPSAFARASRHVVPACIVFTHSHVVRVRPIRRGPFRSPGTWGSTSLMWLMGWLHYPKMRRSRPQHSSPSCSVRERGTRDPSNGNHVRSLLSFALPDASPEHRGVGGPKFLDVSNRPHSPQGVVCDGLSPQPRRGSGARSKHALNVAPVKKLCWRRPLTDQTLKSYPSNDAR